MAGALASGVPLTGKIPKHGKPAPAVTAPADEGPFTREQILEIYRADVIGPESVRLAVMKKHGLADAAGREVPAKIEAYEAALGKFAEARRDEWSAIVEQVSADAARVTTATPGDVDRK